MVAPGAGARSLLMTTTASPSPAFPDDRVAGTPVLLLNGVSSAGKSTAARAIQDRAERPCLVVSVDDLGAGLPADLLARARTGQVTLSEQRALSALVPALEDSLRELARRVADSGTAVIVDAVLQRGADDVLAWRRYLHRHTLTLVRVHAPACVVRHRELARADRPNGLAAAQDRVHLGVDYDVDLDTSGADTEGAATALARRFLPDIARHHHQKEVTP